jgi:uncharacterized protein (DUF169 family)
MTADNGTLAREITSLLRLAAPPIGIIFGTDDGTRLAPRYQSDPPAPTSDGRTGAVPAGCVFWFEAVDKMFSTLVSDHANCSVGMYTHGFGSLDEAAVRADVGVLLSSGWITEADIPRIAHIGTRSGSVVYGPLARMSVRPDVVFIRMNAKQAMIIDDAMGGVRFEGKPQCHIIAIAKDEGQIAISVGCMLSRVRTRMSNNELTCAIPAAMLAEVVAKLRRNVDTERAVASYAAEDLARFAG